MMFWFSECRAMITITQFIEWHWMSFSVCCPLLPNSEALGEKNDPSISFVTIRNLSICHEKTSREYLLKLFPTFSIHSKSNFGIS